MIAATWKGSNSRREALLSLGVVTTTTLLAVLVYNHTRTRGGRSNRPPPSSARSKSKDGPIKEEKSREVRLPSHIERDLHKEERRRRMLPILSMKKPMYDNILMQDPNGHALSTISMKKANWYINKGLADWVNETTIRLRFTPSNRVDPDQALYFVSEKANRCVICGASQHFMRHYVVPFCYRTLFPDSYKTHLSHDVVLTCADCHIQAERSAQCRRQYLEDSLRTDPATAAPQIFDPQKQNIQRTATALLKWRERLPKSRIVECEDQLRAWFQLGPDQYLSLQLLQQASALNSYSPNPRYIPGPELVVNPLLRDEVALAKFIREWRAHFLETQLPRYLPKGWSIESPVQCDKRKHRE